MNAPAPPPNFTITHRRVLAIAVPMTLANATTPLLGVVATAAIGRLGEAHLLGAVAMASVVFDCLFWLFAFLRLATIALTAQALGAGDVAEERATLIRALLLAAAIGLALIVLQVPLGSVVFRLMGASPDVTHAAELYFHVRIWSAPFVLGNGVLLGWLIGLAYVNTALALQILVNAVNLVATVVLVLYVDLGVTGAAFAAVLAEGTGMLVGLVVAFRLVGGAALPALGSVFDRKHLTRLFLVNRDIFIRTAALIAAWGFFTAQGARSGDVILAANSVLHNLLLVGAFFLDGFAAAAQQLCGRAVGARHAGSFRRAVSLSIGWSFGFGAAITLLTLALGPWLIDLMTASPDVRLVARDYLIYAALASAIGVFAFTYDGIYIGATWTRDIRNLMIVSFAIYLAAWWVLRPLGNTGLWLALLIYFGARGILQALRYPALARVTFRTATGPP